MPYDDLRKGRFSHPHQTYLITTVTADRHPWFHDLYLARLIIREMRRMEVQGALYTLAWVLMPDHLHWLFQLGASSRLDEAMHRFKGRSALIINQALNRHGPFWQRAYHDRTLRAGEDLPAMARYLIANPIRAGLVESAGDYPHWDAAWLDDSEIL
jgi:putative transposase